MSIDQLRTILLIASASLLFLMWRAWQTDHAPQPPPREATVQTRGVPAPPKSAVTANRTEVPAPPVSDDRTRLPARTTEAEPPRDLIHVRTDALQATIDPKGGTIVSIKLLHYLLKLDSPDEPFPLLDAQSTTRYVAQTGLIGARAAPSHHALFTATRRDFSLKPGEDELSVTLNWANKEGLKVTKRYKFRRDSYLIEVTQTVENNLSAPWSGRMYAQLQRANVTPKSSFMRRNYSFTGGVISSAEKPYEKLSFSDMAKQDLARTVSGGWIGFIQHYFAAAWIPTQDTKNYIYSKALGQGLYALGIITPPLSVAPGKRGSLEVKLYAGPKIQQRLEKLAPHLERTIDYGWLWFIAEPLFWLLQKIHAVVANWGWAIIILTCLIKLVFFHLSATSYKSMARMRKLQPRIVALREHYSGDKQRMNQAMMQLYKKEKINPLGGCLPIAVQIPVFIALYWVLLESVELRQTPFMFWIRDLSVNDPYFVLPIIMGITMFLQQRLNPAPPDPLQAKVMMALPIVFTFFFLFFPAGLVLYWIVNNVLSIAQQWVITRKIVGTA